MRERGGERYRTAAQLTTAKWAGAGVGAVWGRFAVGDCEIEIGGRGERCRTAGQLTTAKCERVGERYRTAAQLTAARWANAWGSGVGPMGHAARNGREAAVASFSSRGR